MRLILPVPTVPYRTLFIFVFAWLFFFSPLLKECHPLHSVIHLKQYEGKWLGMLYFLKQLSVILIGQTLKPLQKQDDTCSWNTLWVLNDHDMGWQPIPVPQTWCYLWRVAGGALLVKPWELLSCAAYGTGASSSWIERGFGALRRSKKDPR